MASDPSADGTLTNIDVGREDGVTSLLDQLALESYHDRQLSELRSVRAALSRSSEASANTAAAVSSSATRLIGVLNEWGSKQQRLLGAGFTAVALRLEGQAQILSGVRDSLANPETTRGAEQRRRGIDAYRRGATVGEPRWFEDARRDLSRAIELDPYDAVAYTYIGQIAALVDGDDEAALTAFSESAHYAWPDAPEVSSNALLWRALLLAARGDLPAAIAEAGEAERRAPTLAATGIALARYHLRAGNREEAAKVVLRALDLNPSIVIDVENDDELGHAEEIIVVIDSWADRPSASRWLAAGHAQLQAFDEWAALITDDYFDLATVPAVAMRLAALSETRSLLNERLHALAAVLDNVNRLELVQQVKPAAQASANEADRLRRELRDAIASAEFSRSKRGLARLRDELLAEWPEA